MVRQAHVSRRRAPLDLQAAYQKAMTENWSADLTLHLPVLYAAAAERERPVIIELGTRHGISTVALMAGAEVSGGEVWSVDIDPAVDPRVFPWSGSPAWHFACGDSISAEVLTSFPPKADVLFIDTAHTYTQTLAELYCWVPRIRPGGIALLHDTQYFQLGWQDIDLGKPEGAVAKALDAYCQSQGLSWENRPGSYGLGIIRL